MSEAHSTTPGKPGKPSKPTPDFPLFPHAAGVWAKKIRGKLHYFGPWDDPDGALKKYLEQKDALHAGKKPRADPETLTVKEAANKFLNAKRALVDAGELSPRTFAGYKIAAIELVKHLGKARLVSDLDPPGLHLLAPGAVRHRASARVPAPRSSLLSRSSAARLGGGRRQGTAL
jgi:hypothetical protein